MPAKTATVSAPAEAAIAVAPTSTPTSAQTGVRYRVLPKGAGLVHTGASDPVSGAALTFDKGAVVAGAEPAVAAQLEDRGLVEVLGPA
jgi:hypothetical protein